MKQIFVKFLKGFLVVSAVLLVLLLVFGVVLSLDWPWWVGFFVLLGLVGIGIGLVLLKRIWQKRREQEFVQEVVAQDDAYLKKLDDKEKERSRELQERWKEAIDTLRQSHLKKYGNPLYVLPWYVVIGESGSGKTTAIKSARLSSPFAEVNRISGVSGTRNCDWWFFEQAVLLDTAGRYAIPVDEGQDKEEWQRFLGLLAKFRKKEPLNGLVVTVAADKLLGSSSEVLEEDGRNIRRRIDELMRVLGTKFPVYVLVSKCDLVQGMTQFCDHLSDNVLDQAMGVVNRDTSGDVVAFGDRCIRVVGDRLRDLRLLLFHEAGSRGSASAVEPSLFLFPEEFEKLDPGLKAFLRGAFQENPYQETPHLRGVFFSSGRQEGSPYSHFLNALGLIQQRDVLPGTSKGLFLHDFFAKILPKDRRLFAPTQRAIEWGKLTRNLGLTAWVAVALAICGLLSFSFVKNLKTLRHVSRQYTEAPVFEGNILSDVVLMSHFRDVIATVELDNESWWIPRFGLNESKDVEQRLKEKYCKQFRESFLIPFDTAMRERMTGFSAVTSDLVLAQHVAHLARRINLLRGVLEGKEPDALAAMPRPSYAPIMVMADQEVIPEIRKKFADLYLYYLLWRHDEGQLNREMNELQEWLKHVVTLKESPLNWVVTWVNGEGGSEAVELGDFWKGGNSAGETDIGVAPAFSVAGKAQVDAFLAEVEAALTDPLVMASKKLEFQGWYRKAYVEAWHDFLGDFSLGANRLQTRQERQQIAVTMGTDSGPYFLLLERMTTELAPWKDHAEIPDWVELVYAFSETKIRGRQHATMKDKSGLLKVTKKGKRLVDKLGRKIKQVDTDDSLKSELVAAKAYNEYEESLSNISSASASRAAAYDMAADTYKADAATSDVPFHVAHGAVEKLQAYLGEGKSKQEVFWQLVAGPLDYLWHFMRMETACYLQEVWEKEVLVELQGISNQQTINELLLGDNGYAKKFVEGPAGPFVNRSLKKGYYGKRVLGEPIPFVDGFLTFLTKGARSAKPAQGSYTVTIRGLPTDTNQDAQLKVHATRLEIQCADETKTMVNLNYPVRKTFEWSPRSCGDVLLEINVGKTTVTKKYKGYRGFPEFLKDFATGQHTFYPGDFPAQKAALQRLNVKYIKVNYRLKGQEPVLKLLGTAPGRVPRGIAECWDR